MSASVLAESVLLMTMTDIAELAGVQCPVDRRTPDRRELAHAGRRSGGHSRSAITADSIVPLDIPIIYPHDTHMTSGDSTADAYAELAEAARAARARYDALLVDPVADPNDVDLALAMAKETEKARDRAGRELARKRAAAQSAQRSVRRSGSRRGRDDKGPSTLALRPATSDKTEAFTVGRQRQREQVADVLELLGAPARTPTVIAAVRHVHARELTSAQLVQLRREEQRQYRRARDQGGLATLRPWYLVPCLSADTLTAAAGTYALSTWPAVDRLITPYAPRLWVAHSVRNLSATLLRSPRQADGLNELLRTLLRGTSWGYKRHATDVRQSESASQWLQSVIVDAAADAEHLQHQHQRAAVDAQDRLAALAERDPAVPLWGVPRPSEAQHEG